MGIVKKIPFSIRELLIGVAILICTILLIGGSRLVRLEGEHAISTDRKIDIYLSKTVDLENLTDILSDSGIVKDRSELMWAGRLLGWNKFSVGHYQVEGDYSYDMLLSKMARGIQDPVTLTIIPGSTEERIAGKILSTFQFDSLSLYKTLNDSSFLENLEFERQDLLGRLFPDTYALYWTSSPETVIKRIVNQFDISVVEANEQEFEETGKSVNEIVTLASIIEWEASKAEEKPKISGLYWNRLNRGMRLQADPTVNFAVKERRRLLYEDYEIDHPYNTYMNRGLPPGPITNPSLNSIKAALKPASHDYLYMVASPEGSHIFSETFEQHKRESAKWREWIREQYRKKRQQEAENSKNTNS